MKKTLSHLLVVGAVVIAYLLGAFAPLERGLASLRFQLLDAPASGDIVVVGIDNPSLRGLNIWPWPREYHAALVDRLVAAGAARIAIDIDFSSKSNEESDSRFEAALARGGNRMIMATFKQPALDENGNEVWIYTAPIPRLARHGMLGHVNVQVEADSLVWRYSTFEEIGDIRLPGMATLMANSEGGAARSFTIDYAIRPETLPYMSYIEVLRDNFDPAFFRGKTVIVGATALELGDRIPVPVHSVLPGPIVQALIAETLYQDRGLNPLDPRVAALVALALGIVLAWFIAQWSWQGGGILVAGLAVSMFAVSLGVQSQTRLLLEISPLVLAPLAVYLLNLTRSIDRLTGAFRLERFEALYRRAMMSAVVDSGFDGIAIADRDGRIELVNPSGARLVGKSDGELTGLPIHTVLPWSPEIEALYAHSEDGQRISQIGPLELPLKRGDETLTVEMVVNAARLTLQSRKGAEPDERSVYIYTFRDITDRKRVEEAQRKAVDEAEAANRAKTEFLHNMSHELRTPLNAIIGFSDILKSQMMGPLGTDQYVDYAKDINESGQHLLEVVNDILDMSKIESGEIKLDEAELVPRQVIEASRRMIEERAKAARLEVVVDAPADMPGILADDRMVKQMLLNLLSNAVKFTPEGGRLTIGARVEPDGATVLWVADTGIGIDSKDFATILEPFGQADASLSREYEGTGLGLPLVKSMIELHDGQLFIESEIGEGSTFSLRFPAHRLRDMGAAAAPGRVAAG